MVSWPVVEGLGSRCVASHRSMLLQPPYGFVVVVVVVVIIIIIIIIIISFNFKFIHVY